MSKALVAVDRWFHDGNRDLYLCTPCSNVFERLVCVSCLMSLGNRAVLYVSDWERNSVRPPCPPELLAAWRAGCDWRPVVDWVAETCPKELEWLITFFGQHTIARTRVDRWRSPGGFPSGSEIAPELP